MREAWGLKLYAPLLVKPTAIIATTVGIFFSDLLISPDVKPINMMTHDG